MVTFGYHIKVRKMKKNIISLAAFLALVSCNPSSRDNSTSEKANDEKPAVQAESSFESDPTIALYSYTFDQEQETHQINQLRPFDNDTLTGEGLERIINKTWPQVQIEYTGTSNDTAFVSIPDSQVLTQQMGSSGAESFLVTTTWSFTELKGIQHVLYDFEVGDHAMPGVYNRNSWEGLKKGCTLP
jgi:hypothetical protein